MRARILFVLCVLSLGTIFIFSGCGAKKISELKSYSMDLNVPEDFRLMNRIVNAKLIIVGKVLGILQVEYQRKEKGDPDWHWAVVQVTSILKGRRHYEVGVLFPKSTEGRWMRSPKFEINHEGIWFLSSEIQHFDSKTSRHAFKALHPLDFHSMPHLHYIQQLIR